MDLFPLLKTALVLFSTFTLLFLVFSFFIYKWKTKGRAPRTIEPAQHASLRYSRENVVHSIAMPEKEEILFFSSPAVEKPVAPIPVRTTQTRFQVVNSPKKGDILLQFNYNTNLSR